MKIFVSGLLNVETTVAVRKFPIEYYPIDYPFFGTHSNVSGVGFNIAKALSVLDDEVILSSFIGEDSEGERVLRSVSSLGIGLDGIRRSLKETPTSVVLYDPQGRRQIYCDLKDIQEQMLDADTLPACDVAALCNINFNRDLIKTARSRGILTATDVHVLSDIEDEYNRDFLENADILFLSDEALPEAPADFIRRLYERYHNRVIVIGMGDKGAMALDGRTQEVTMLSAYPAERIVNTVGAGDALFSSFLHFYLKGDDVLLALQKAEVFAAVKIGFNGASVGFADEKTVEEMFAQKRRTMPIFTNGERP